MGITNVVSMSGGKDSTALALLAIERQAENVRYVFADTGHEHAQTYEYVEYLRHKLMITIDVVRADFSDRFAKRREYVATKWPEKGVPQADVDRALSALRPTGNPFLDLCIIKGRFPSTRARFCSQELKHDPLNAHIQRIATGCDAAISWQGVRRDESASRSMLPERDIELGTWEPEPRGLLIYRPILDWTVNDVFAMHKKHGIEPNPLYKQGMCRVGCMPCIHARKDELRQIALRFPAEIERVAEWERIVSAAAKMGMATFWSAVGQGNENVNLETHGINAVIDWSNTARGGKQRSLIHMLDEQDADAGVCSSQYGLCE